MLKLIRKSLQIVQKDKPDQPIEKSEQTSTKLDPDKAAIILQSWYRAQIQRARKAQLKRANSEKLQFLSPFPGTSAATSRNHSSLHMAPRGGSPSTAHAPLDIFNVHAPPRHDHLFDHVHNAPSSGFESYHSRSSSISTESYHSRTASGGASSDKSGVRAILGLPDASEDIRARCRKKLDWSTLMTELLHEAESREHGSDDEQQPLSGVEPQEHVPNMGTWEQQIAAPSPSRKTSLLSKTYGMDDFEIFSMLGDGDSGKVCLARLRGTDRIYAMKIISKQRVLQEKKIHRVMTERTMLARADHPFVVKLYLAFQTLTDLCFVMEYCPGGELFKVMQSQPNKCLSEHDARFYAAEVLLALEYVHMLGFIYRDLKPENILLDKDGHIKLIDFDLSKRAVSDYQAHFIRPRKYGQKASRALGLIDIQPRDRFTSRVGTCGYAAPEVLNGDGHTSSADWWTFGVLLYEMLFGRLPFNGTQLQQLQQMRGDSIEIPESPVVSQHCKHLIKKLLTYNPKKRLGRKHGASEIKQHPFFSTINWPLIRKNPGPIVPAKISVPPSTRRPQGRTSPGHSKPPAYPTHLPTSPSKK